MSLEQLSKTVDFVQATTPSNANDGETYLDTSQSPPQLKVFDSSANAFVRPRSIQNLDAPVSNAGATQSDIADGVDSSNLSDEITSGRTRELLLLLQDKSVPEVQDPLNEQTSQNIITDNSDYELFNSSLASTTASLDSVDQLQSDLINYGITVSPNDKLTDVSVTTGPDTTGIDEIKVYQLEPEKLIKTISGSWGGGEEIPLDVTLDSSSDYTIVASAVTGGINKWETTSFPFTSGNIDIVGGAYSGTGVEDNAAWGFQSVTGGAPPSLSGYVTDQFSAPTTAPTDFKQWNAIRAEDVTTGGSTSADPVEFEILDSSDTALNSTRIPKARIADEPFTMRNRVYSEDAGSNGQSDYTIATTGDGGHFGIPVLTVVSVKKNGSVLESANWSFDGTDTVTIDTSNVTIASGDTIDIKYDFDVFDSTLQPRAYLSRESSSETSPSISHFEYEYVI